MSPIRKKTVDEFLDEWKLDTDNYSDEELRTNIASGVQKYIRENGKFSSYGNAGRLDLQNQSTVLINQNELTHRQNERIIHLLEKLVDKSLASDQNACPQCNAVCGGMAFCSQCGHELRS